MPSSSSSSSSKPTKAAGADPKSQATKSAYRRGAVSCQSPGEYKRLQARNNDKDKLVQYIDASATSRP